MAKAALLAIAVACLAAFVWWAGPGTAKDEPPSRAGLAVAGDGQLPTSRPEVRDARDPLSTAEAGYAISVATRDPEVPSGAKDVRGEPGPEVLSVDVPDADVDDDTRRAVVTLYDYASDTTYVQIVDLSRGRLEDSQAAKRLQPSPSANEAQVAVSIALTASPPLAFVGDFEASEGVPLVSSDQIASVAGVWTHDDGATHAHGDTGGHGHGDEGGHEHDGAGPGHACGEQRCIRLIVAAPSGRYLDTTGFVVNLSRRTVVRLDGGH